jgi:hypothetical protein
LTVKDTGGALIISLISLMMPEIIFPSELMNSAEYFMGALFFDTTKLGATPR